MATSVKAKVKGATMHLDSLKELLHEELQDIYDAEHQIVEAMPKMIEAASSRRLKEAFREHLEESKGQSERLKEVFRLFGWKPERHSCDGMKGLLKEGTKVISARGEAAVKDAALISAAQRVEHYEIAAYGSARTYASMLGNDEACDMLQTTLEQEGETDRRLTEIALSSVNEKAMAA